MKSPWLFFFLFCVLTPLPFAEAHRSPLSDRKSVAAQGRSRQDVMEHSLGQIRRIQQRHEALLLSEKRWMDARRPRYSPAQKAAAQREAGYILESQFEDPASFFDGAINNVYGAPTWIVPRENALAMLALLQASEVLKDPSYRTQAERAGDFLIRVQDEDGGWFDQYDWRNPADHPETDGSKSPTQTAEVMMALDQLGFSAARYEAMKKGAEFLISLQDTGDGLLVGGLMDDGVTRHTWKWASDNSFAYLALKDAAGWARKAGDRALAKRFNDAASRILAGINEVLYIDDPSHPDYGVWHRVVDANGVPQQTGYREWINYAPQMLDLPATGVGNARVGEWIHQNLQLSNGAVVWDNGGPNSSRQSPGFSFQAALVWLDLGQTAYADAAVQWAYSSGLLQTVPDSSGITGGWVDWLVDDPSTPGIDERAQEWERFIDTSFYALSVQLGGYNFRS